MAVPGDKAAATLEALEAEGVTGAKIGEIIDCEQPLIMIAD